MLLVVPCQPNVCFHRQIAGQPWPARRKTFPTGVTFNLSEESFFENTAEYPKALYLSSYWSLNPGRSSAKICCLQDLWRRVEEQTTSHEATILEFALGMLNISVLARELITTANSPGAGLFHVRNCV
jgi:hypothetical protein